MDNVCSYMTSYRVRKLTGRIAGSSRWVHGNLCPAGNGGRSCVGLCRRASISVVTAPGCGRLLDTSGLLGHMGLIVLSQVCLLAEAFAAERAGKRFFAGMRPDVHVHAVLVFEALAADAAVVQRAFLALNATGRTTRAASLLLSRIAAGVRAGIAVACTVCVVAVTIRTPDVFLCWLGSDADACRS